MPINPNIALGIQPIQQPNMLAQYAQVMGIKAAQQEMEGSQEARDYFSKPVSERGDPSRLLGTKQGQAAFKALNEGQIKQLEATQKRVNLIGAGAGAVLENPTVENFRSVVENLVRNQVYSREDADKAIATIGNDASKIPSFVTPLYRQAISAEKDLSDKTSRYSTNVAAGTAAKRLAFDVEGREYDRANPTLQRAEGENGFYLYNPRDPNSAVPLGMRPSAPPAAAPVAQPSAVNNLMMTTQSAPSVNALTQTAPNQAGPTVAAANALANQPTIIKPKSRFTTPVPVIDPITGNTVLMEGQKAVATGATPATPATEARQVAIRKLPNAIAQSKDALNLINRMVGTPDGKTKPHEGFKGAVGAGVGMRFIPGTSARDFQAMHEQITGGAFMQAFETLKGGGQITEKEGEKATAAITRMSLATSEKEYMVAAREFQEVIRRGIQNAEKELRSGPGGGGGAAPKTVTRTGTLNGRKVVEYSDGTTAYAD